MAKKRKGGVQQRMRAVLEEEDVTMREQPDYVCTSVLATFLLTLFAQGEMSPQRLQYLCALVLKDVKAMQTNPMILNDLEVMANIGSGGKYPNKMHGDLMRATSHISKLPAPVQFKSKFKKPIGEQNQSLLLPHEVFASVYEHYPATWLESICPKQDSLEEFWETASKHPLMEGHPACEKHNWQRLCVPLGLHGDGVPVVGIGKIWPKLLNVWSWFSLIGQGNTRAKMFYTYSCFDKTAIPGFSMNHTLGPAFKLLQWSFYWLFRGVWPDRDPDGNRRPVCVVSQKTLRHKRPWVFLPFNCVECEKPGVREDGITQWCRVYLHNT